MLFSLLPTTVLAAGNYPAANAVSVDGGKSFQSPSKLYYKNGDGNKTFSGNAGDYNAHYDSATGTLTLNGYDGGSITVGGANNYTDITVVLIGTNIINGSLTNDVGGDITITTSTESGGTLSITKKASDSSNAAIGIETGWSASYDSGKVTIDGQC